MFHTTSKDVKIMKKMMLASSLGLACGAGMVAYLLTNKKTKRNADKLLNTMMDEASDKIQKKSV